MHAAPDLLVILAQSGDREALDAVLQRVQEKLFRYIARLIVSAPEVAAEDVLQETLLRIARKLRWLDDPQLFEAWAYRIASREAYRALGKRRLSEPIDEEIAAPLETAPAMTWSELEPLIDQLSPSSRAVVLLCYGEQCSLNEIAAVLEIPLGTVKSRLSYGLQKLRPLVQSHRDRVRDR